MPVEKLEARQLLAAAISHVVSPWLPATQYLAKSGDYLTHANRVEPLTQALTYLTANAKVLGLASRDIADPIVTDNYTDADTGITHLYLRQQFAGLPIVNSNINFNIARNGRILSLGGGFVSTARTSASSRWLPIITASQAILNLSGFAPSGATSIKVTKLAGTQASASYSAPQISLDPIAPRLVYLSDGKKLNLTWDVAIRTPDGAHWYDLNVDARTGKYSSGVDWAEHATYNVYSMPTEGPGDTVSGTLPRTVVTDPYDPTVSPFGWHDTNGVTGAEFTDTRGNNVSAQDDTDANNTGGTRPDGGASLNFDFPLDLSLSPSSYLSAATTNLFYWNNILHDVHARYGFTEAAGNFQVMNYSGSGSGNDAVQADAQDGSGTNNANFVTPPDGTAPRMQMFNFTYTSPGRDGDLDNQIVVHEYGHGVSNRLTGGPSNSNALDATQSGGMGEGWSDWWGLMFTMKPGDLKTGKYPVGTYVLGQNRDTGAGIRRYPYAFDTIVDPLTFNYYNTDSSKEVHNTGEIWCTALFDMAWLLIDKYGYSADITKGYDPAMTGRNSGNNLALQLVMDGLKLQPANPSFTQARDAILQADQVRTGGANKLQIWSAFARRGLGYSASTSSSSSTSVTIATDLPADLLKPRVASISPSAPSTSPISTLDLNFSKAMDPTSFSIASDVVSFTAPDGSDLLPTVSGFSWLNSNTTLRLTFTPVSTNGNYTLTVGPNILAGDDASAMDQSGDGTAGQVPGDRYTATFAYDAVPLAVDATSPAANAVINIPFTTIDWTFNEPINPASLSASDLTLSQGTVTSAVATDATHARFTLSGISNEGALTLSMSAGAVTDVSGYPNVAFSESFTVDIGTRALPGTTRAQPYGSLIYSTSTTGSINPGLDADDFTLVLDAGQTVTAILKPTTATLRPVMSILGPSGTVLGTTAAAAANQEAVVQTISVSTAGTYTFRCGSVASTVGDYALQVLLNAAVSNEDHGGTSDGTPAGAQNIDASFLPLSNGYRGAVTGKTEASGGALTNEVEPNNSLATANTALANFVPSSASLYQMCLKTTASSSSDYDYFNIGTLRAGDVITIASNALSSLRGTNSDPHIYLYRGIASSPTQVTSDGHSGPGSSDALIYRYAVTTADTYYVSTYPFNTGTLDLTLYLEAGSTAPLTGGTVTTETESNNTAATANDASSGWRKVQYESHTSGTLPTGDYDYYAYNFSAGDLVTFVGKGDASTHPRTALMNSSGTILSQEDGGSSYGGNSSSNYAYIIPSTGTYYYQVYAYSGTASYSADVYLSTTTPPPLPNTNYDYYSFSATAGEHLTAVASTTAGTVTMTLRDAGGAVLGTGVTGNANVSQAIADIVAPATGTYYLTFAASGAAVDYSAVIDRNLAFDLKPHDTLATAQDITGATRSLGYLTGLSNLNVEPDNYAAGTALTNVVAGVTLSISETTSTVISQTHSYISTGTRGFYNSSSGYFMDSSGYRFRATFTVPVTSVSLDLIPDDSDDPGVIRAYNSAGVLLQEVLVPAPALGSYAKMTVSRTAGDIAYIEAGGQSGQTAYLDNLVVGAQVSTSDYYAIQLNAGQSRNFSTSTPGDGAGEFVNVLDDRLDLYDPSGNLVATNDNGASDGRNASLSFTAAATGVYRVRVTSMRGTAGEYMLSSGDVVSVTLPASTRESDGTINATLSVLNALPTDLTVNLASSNPGRLSVPATVILPAGQLSVAVPFTILDNTLLDGPETITVSTSAIGYSGGVGTITLNDDESAALSITLPTATVEGASSVTGSVTATAAPTRDISVLLSSSDTGKLTVPASVTLLAGQTTATFSATVVNNTVMEGTKNVVITASVPNWTTGTATVAVADNDATIALSIPTTGWEGQSLTTGLVTIGGTLGTPLVINLVSNDTTEVTLPATVTIPAGSTSAAITLTLPTDGLKDGTISASISASNAIVGSATANIAVHDSDLDQLGFDTIASPKTAGTSFAVVGRAYNVISETIPSFAGTAVISATGSAGAVTITTTTATFTSGAWSGTETITLADPTITLKLTSGTTIGTSNIFAVNAAALSSLTWGPVTPLQTGGIPFAQTLTAKDAYGNRVTSYAGTASLSGLVATQTTANILGTVGYTSTVNATYTTGYSFTPNTNFTLTHFRSFFGTKVTLWNSSGTVLATQAVSGTAGVWTETPLATPITLTAGATYYLGAYAGGGTYYYRSTASTLPSFLTSMTSYYYPGDGIPTYSESSRYHNVDLKGTFTNFASGPVTPATATFSGGLWSGNVTVTQATSQYKLHVDDGAGHIGDSATFAVAGQDLAMIVPSEVLEDDGVFAGQLSVSFAPSSDLVVQLTSSDPTRLSVPSTVTIPAGQTSVALPLTVLDNLLLDGPKSVTISATTAGYTTAVGVIKVHDDETAVLSVTLPASSAREGDALLTGTITASAAPATDTTITLTSSVAARAGVPATVILPAGQTSVNFSLNVINNTVIDGNVNVTIAASAGDWTMGYKSISIRDNDNTLAITLPTTTIWEGQTLTNAGTVSLGGTASADVLVLLSSGDTTELTVPQFVTITAGLTSATFTFSAVLDNLKDGSVIAPITAAASGLSSATSTLIVHDADLDHVGFDTISGTKTAGTAFAVVARAYNSSGEQIGTLSSTASLSAVGASGTYAVTPATVTFTSGAWSGSASLVAIDPAAALVIQLGGVSGQSNTFPITSPALGAPTLAAVSDTGLSQSDRITRNNNATPATALQFVVSGTFAGATVKIYANGVPVGTAVATSTLTTVTTSGATTVPDGSVSFTATQVFPGGETAASTALAVTIDTVAPVAPGTPDLQPGSDTGKSTTDNITKKTQPAFNITAAEAGILHINVDGAVSATSETLATGGTYALSPYGGSANFSNEIPVTVGGSPSFVAVGDLNNDGRADIVASNLLSLTLSVLLSKPGDTFQSTALLSLTDYGYQPTIADFNRDGKADLAVRVGAAVSIYLGNGDGTFAAPTKYATLTGAYMRAVDVNGDSKLDLVCTGSSVTSAATLLGNGDGTFQTSTSSALGTAAYGLTIGDFDRDGKLDMVVANSSATIYLCRGTGAGTFSTGAFLFSGGGSFLGTESADLNKDGKLDIVVGDNSLAKNVYVLLGNGDGTFQSAITNASAAGTMVVVQDFNRDGNLDIAATDNSTSIGVLYGNGDGTFQGVVRLTSATTSTFVIAAGDINNDLLPDLVVGHVGGSNVSVYLGRNLKFADGSHTVASWIEDLAGNVSPVSAALPMTVDTVAPVVTAVANSTSDSTPPLAGTINEATAAVLIKIDNYAVMATNNGDGTWTLLDNAITPALAVNTYTYTAIATDLAGNSTSSAGATLAILAPPSLASVVVNDGSAQRSVIQSLTLNFTTPVVLSPGAVELQRRGIGSVGLIISNPSGDQKTFLVTFTDPALVGGRLLDGLYDLVVHNAKVKDLFNTTPIGADSTAIFHRLFGDSDGDRDVDSVDAGAMSKAYNSVLGDANYNSIFDYNADGKIDSVVDMLELKKRQLKGFIY